MGTITLRSVLLLCCVIASSASPIKEENSAADRKGKQLIYNQNGIPIGFLARPVGYVAPFMPQRQQPFFPAVIRQRPYAVPVRTSYAAPPAFIGRPFNHGFASPQPIRPFSPVQNIYATPQEQGIYAAPQAFFGQQSGTAFGYKPSPFVDYREPIQKDELAHEAKLTKEKESDRIKGESEQDVYHFLVKEVKKPAVVVESDEPMKPLSVKEAFSNFKEKYTQSLKESEAVFDFNEAEVQSEGKETVAADVEEPAHAFVEFQQSFAEKPQKSEETAGDGNQIDIELKTPEVAVKNVEQQSEAAVQDKAAQVETGFFDEQALSLAVQDAVAGPADTKTVEDPTVVSSEEKYVDAAVEEHKVEESLVKEVPELSPVIPFIHSDHQFSEPEKAQVVGDSMGKETGDVVESEHKLVAAEAEAVQYEPENMVVAQQADSEAEDQREITSDLETLKVAVKYVEHPVEEEAQDESENKAEKNADDATEEHTAEESPVKGAPQKASVISITHSDHHLSEKEKAEVAADSMGKKSDEVVELEHKFLGAEAETVQDKPKNLVATEQADSEADTQPEIKADLATPIEHAVEAAAWDQTEDKIAAEKYEETRFMDEQALSDPILVSYDEKIVDVASSPRQDGDHPVVTPQKESEVSWDVQTDESKFQIVGKVSSAEANSGERVKVEFDTLASKPSSDGNIVVEVELKPFIKENKIEAVANDKAQEVQENHAAVVADFATNVDGEVKIHEPSLTAPQNKEQSADSQDDEAVVEEHKRSAQDEKTEKHEAFSVGEEGIVAAHFSKLSSPVVDEKQRFVEDDVPGEDNQEAAKVTPDKENRVAAGAEPTQFDVTLEDEGWDTFKGNVSDDVVQKAFVQILSSDSADEPNVDNAAKKAELAAPALAVIENEDWGSFRGDVQEDEINIVISEIMTSRDKESPIVDADEGVIANSEEVTESGPSETAKEEISVSALAATEKEDWATFKGNVREGEADSVISEIVRSRDEDLTGIMAEPVDAEQLRASAVGNPFPSFILNELQSLQRNLNQIPNGDYLSVEGLDAMTFDVTKEEERLNQLRSALETFDESYLAKTLAAVPETDELGKVATLVRNHASSLKDVDLTAQKDLLQSMINYDKDLLELLHRMRSKLPIRSTLSDEQLRTSAVENPFPSFILNELQSLQRNLNQIPNGDYLSVEGLDAMTTDVTKEEERLNQLRSALESIQTLDESYLAKTLAAVPETVPETDELGKVVTLVRNHASSLKDVDLTAQKDLLQSMINYDKDLLELLQRMRSKLPIRSALSDTKAQEPKPEALIPSVALAYVTNLASSLKRIPYNDYSSAEGIEKAICSITLTRSRLIGLLKFQDSLEESIEVKAPGEETANLDDIEAVQNMYRNLWPLLSKGDKKEHRNTIESIVDFEDDALEFMKRLKLRFEESLISVEEGSRTKYRVDELQKQIDEEYPGKSLYSSGSEIGGYFSGELQYLRNNIHLLPEGDYASIEGLQAVQDRVRNDREGLDQLLSAIERAKNGDKLDDLAGSAEGRIQKVITQYARYGNSLNADELDAHLKFVSDLQRYNKNVYGYMNGMREILVLAPAFAAADKKDQSNTKEETSAAVESIQKAVITNDNPQFEEFSHQEGFKTIVTNDADNRDVHFVATVVSPSAIAIPEAPESAVKFGSQITAADQVFDIVSKKHSEGLLAQVDVQNDGKVSANDGENVVHVIATFVAPEGIVLPDTFADEAKPSNAHDGSTAVVSNPIRALDNVDGIVQAVPATDDTAAAVEVELKLIDPSDTRLLNLMKENGAAVLEAQNDQADYSSDPLHMSTGFGQDESDHASEFVKAVIEHHVLEAQERKPEAAADPRISVIEINNAEAPVLEDIGVKASDSEYTAKGVEVEFHLVDPNESKNLRLTKEKSPAALEVQNSQPEATAGPQIFVFESNDAQVSEVNGAKISANDTLAEGIEVEFRLVDPSDSKLLSLIKEKGAAAFEVQGNQPEAPTSIPSEAAADPQISVVESKGGQKGSASLEIQESQPDAPTGISSEVVADPQMITKISANEDTVAEGIEVEFRLIDPSDSKLLSLIKEKGAAAFEVQESQPEAPTRIPSEAAADPQISVVESKGAEAPVFDGSGETLISASEDTPTEGIEVEFRLIDPSDSKLLNDIKEKGVAALETQSIEEYSDVDPVELAADLTNQNSVAPVVAKAQEEKIDEPEFLASEQEAEDSAAATQSDQQQGEAVIFRATVAQADANSYTENEQAQLDGQSIFQQIATQDSHPYADEAPAEWTVRVNPHLKDQNRLNDKILSNDQNSFSAYREEVLQHPRDPIHEGAKPDFLYEAPARAYYNKPVEKAPELPTAAEIVLEDGLVVKAAERSDLPARLAEESNLKYRKIVVYEKDGKWFYAGSWRKRKDLEI